jgi:hypothetical protein
MESSKNDQNNDLVEILLSGDEREEFPVNLLTSNSTVLERMFDINMKEKHEKTWNLSTHSPIIVRILLKMMKKEYSLHDLIAYCNRLGPTNKNEESLQDDNLRDARWRMMFKMAENLNQLIDQWQLTGVSKEMEKELETRVPQEQTEKLGWIQLAEVLGYKDLATKLLEEYILAIAEEENHWIARPTPHQVIRKYPTLSNTLQSRAYKIMMDNAMILQNCIDFGQPNRH